MEAFVGKKFFRKQICDKFIPKIQFTGFDISPFLSAL